MYDRKFEQWGVQKNLRRATKERYLKMLVQTGAWQDHNLPAHERHITLSESDRVKLTRYVKSKSRTSKIVGSRHGKRDRPDALNNISSLSPVLSEVASSSTALPMCDGFQLCPRRPVTPSSSCAASCGQESDDYTTMDKANSEASDADDNHEDWILTTRRPAPTASYCSPAAGQTFDILLSLLQPSMPRGPNRQMRSFQGDVLFASVQQYLHSLIPTTRDVPFTKCMWSELSNGMYLLKVGSSNLAWKALDHACDLAPRELSSAKAFDFDFLLQLLSTLSPTNTTVCPRVRRIIIQYFHHLATIWLPAGHPVHTICRELQRDGDELMASERALLCMLDSCSRAVEKSSLSHVQSSRLEKMSFAAEKALIALLRRSGQLDAALSRGKLLHRRWQDKLIPSAGGRLEEQSFGTSGGNEKLRYARAAATQLAHICMAIRSDDAYQAAIELCHFRLHGQSSYVEMEASVEEQVRPHKDMEFANANRQILQDVDSVYAFEDLSKIYDELGRCDLSVHYMQIAVKMAREILPETEETSTVLEHVTDKLMSMYAGTRVAV